MVNYPLWILTKHETIEDVWLGGVMVSMHSEGAGSTLAVALSRNNLGQVVHTHAPLSPSSIIWYPSKSSGALRLGR